MRDFGKILCFNSRAQDNWAACASISPEVWQEVEPKLRPHWVLELAETPERRWIRLTNAHTNSLSLSWHDERGVHDLSVYHSAGETLTGEVLALLRTVHLLFFASQGKVIPVPPRR